ncbi:MAG: ABC transporter permease, partial [Verrucomicrobiota bacterium]
MIPFLFRRLLWTIPVLVIVISCTFLLIRLSPGSPFVSERNLDPEVEKRLLEKYDLDGTWLEQLGNYWGNLLQGNLGVSTQYRDRTVVEILKQTLPKSAALGFFALGLALAIGIFAGSLAAVHHNTRTDRVAMLLALLGICLPSFVIAPILILLFAIIIPIFPVAGWGAQAHLILPVLCLALPYGAYCSRLMRTSMLETLGQNYILTAKAKGVSQITMIYKHAL